jgi:hypothetical protein
MSDIQTALEDAMINGASISDILTDNTTTGDEKAELVCIILGRMIPDEALLRKLQTCAYNHLAEPREQRLERLVSDIYHSRFFDGNAALEDEELDLVSRMRHEIK